MFVYLDYFKAVREHKIVNLKSYYAKYVNNSGYKMFSGTPLIINVEGTYVKVDDLIDLIINRPLVPKVIKWIIATKQPLISEPPFIIFCWRREWTQ